MIKRHEFKDKEDDDALVAFEDGDKNPVYWRRKKAVITYVYTDMTFSMAKKFAEKKVVTQTTFDSSPEEMAEYEKQAAAHHDQIGKDGDYK